MARYYYDGARDTVESTKSLSIFWLKENGYLGKDSYRYGGIKWSINGSPTGNINFSVNTYEEDRHIQLDYRARSGWETEWTDMDYKINLIKTPCFFGGFRWWFQCIHCSRRVGVVYSSSNYFVCRYCANLSYDSCNENKRFRYGIFRIFTDEVKAEKLYKKIKTKFYRGKPTRKYKRYLELQCLDDQKLLEAENTILNDLGNG